MADAGFDHLTSSCPFVLKELLAMLVSPKIGIVRDGQGGAATEPFVVVPPSDLHWHLTSLLHSGEITDVTFQVGPETFAAHRCVLAARSSVFRAELFGRMKEGATDGVVRIDDMEPEAFEVLLDFIYGGEEGKTEGEEGGGEGEDAYAIWQHLLVAADRYDLQRLKLICEEELCKHIDATSAASILALAEQHTCRGLKEACFCFLSFPGNLQDVMANDGLEHLFVSCHSVLKELIARLASIKLDDL